MAKLSQNRQNMYLELEFPQNDPRFGFRTPQNPRSLSEPPKNHPKHRWIGWSKLGQQSGCSWKTACHLEEKRKLNLDRTTCHFVNTVCRFISNNFSFEFFKSWFQMAKWQRLKKKRRGCCRHMWRLSWTRWPAVDSAWRDGVCGWMKKIKKWRNMRKTNGQWPKKWISRKKKKKKDQKQTKKKF